MSSGALNGSEVRRNHRPTEGAEGFALLFNDWGVNAVTSFVAGDISGYAESNKAD